MKEVSDNYEVSVSGTIDTSSNGINSFPVSSNICAVDNSIEKDNNNNISGSLSSCCLSVTGSEMQIEKDDASLNNSNSSEDEFVPVVQSVQERRRLRNSNKRKTEHALKALRKKRQCVTYYCL